MVSKSSAGDSFLSSESDKLEVEIQHAKLYHLRYSQYKYFLDFKSIYINLPSQTATVSVIEGHDVLFEISEEISKTAPIISSMRNLPHSIVLHKEQDLWKIVSDTYNDYLWHLIKKTGLSKEELINSMTKASSSALENDNLQVVNTCLLQSDTSIHEYTRNGTVYYTHRWATTAPPYNHPPYDDFTNMGGDCTNFISQAIHEGGSAEMVGSNSFGWYYNNIYDRAAAWNDVTAMHDFITQYLVWPAGPEGCDVAQYQAYEGALIQYDWTNDGIWDHGAIIVQSEDYGSQNRYHWVAAHTDDVDNYPFSSYIYTYPNMVYRFVHIDRIDGFAMNYLPITIKNENQAKAQPPNPNPYPAPVQKSTPPPAPYPTP